MTRPPAVAGLTAVADMLVVAAAERVARAAVPAGTGPEVVVEVAAGWSQVTIDHGPATVGADPSGLLGELLELCDRMCLGRSWACRTGPARTVIAVAGPDADQVVASIAGAVAARSALLPSGWSVTFSS